MTFQFEQLTYILIYVILGAILWTIRNKDAKMFTFVKIAIVGLVVIMFLFNPIKFKQEGVSKLERFQEKDTVLPARVIVKPNSFDDIQANELKKLKLESMEIVKDEIN